LFQFRANKFLPELQLTKTLINNSKFTFLCFKFITKKYRTCWSQSQKDQSKDTKSDNIKLWEFTLKVFLDILLTPMKQLSKRCKMVAKTDQLLPLKWMPPQVALTLSFQSNSNKRKWSKGKREKNFPLFIWSIWPVVKKSEKPEQPVTDWNKLLVSTRVCRFWVWLSQHWLIRPQVKERTLLSLTETHVWQEFCKMHWEVTQKL